MQAAKTFTAGQFVVVGWAAVECAHQRSGELSVAWMLHAWQHAMRASKNGPPSQEDVLALGAEVEPRKNFRGYRQCGVRVGWDVKLDWRLVPEAMADLVGAVGAVGLDADEWFRQYEEIHPFVDGNGRTGSILWNWLRGSLATPEPPPEYWGPRENITL